MAKRPTVPLKVTAHLLDGRINSADGILMLDSIVYHAWFYKHAPQVLEGHGDRAYDGHIGLPFRQYHQNIWSASKGIYEEEGNSVEYLNKKPNFFNADKLGHLDADKGVISDSQGIYRAYRIPNIIRTVKDGIVTFYCRGHKNELIELLNMIPALAKKNSAGYGIVKQWDVENISEDYSFWHPEYGLMRPVPVDSEWARQYDLSGYPVMRYAIKPPYWKQQNAVLCYVPIKGVSF